jgi:hypothetical protein
MSGLAGSTVTHSQCTTGQLTLKSVRDCQARTCILLAELAELFPERTGSDLLAVVVLPISAGG